MRILTGSAGRYIYSGGRQAARAAVPGGAREIAVRRGRMTPMAPMAQKAEATEARVARAGAVAAAAAAVIAAAGQARVAAVAWARAMAPNRAKSKSS